MKNKFISREKIHVIKSGQNLIEVFKTQSTVYLLTGTEINLRSGSILYIKNK